MATGWCTRSFDHGSQALESGSPSLRYPQGTGAVSVEAGQRLQARCGAVEADLRAKPGTQGARYTWRLLLVVPFWVVY